MIYTTEKKHMIHMVIKKREKNGTNYTNGTKSLIRMGI